MTNNTENSTLLRVAGLDTHKPTAFELTPNASVRTRISQQLGLLDIRKLRFSGHVTAAGKADWRLEAQLGASVVQSCVVSLTPVSTRIDLPVKRDFINGLQIQDEQDEEIEIPTGDDSEALGSHIDLMAVMVEALSLALPLYPKAQDASLETSTFAETGVEPMSDDDARPFAGLAGLRDKLEKDE